MKKDYMEKRMEKSIDYVYDTLKLGEELNYYECIILAQLIMLKKVKSKKEALYILKLINEDLDDYYNTDLQEIIEENKGE